MISCVEPWLVVVKSPPSPIGYFWIPTDKQKSNKSIDKQKEYFLIEIKRLISNSYKNKPHKKRFNKEKKNRVAKRKEN